MKVLLFGKSQRARPKRAGGRRGLALESYSLNDLRAMIPGLEEGTLVYLDLAGVSGPQREKIPTLIRNNPHVLFGILDSAGTVTDVAALFHAGAVDYLGKKLGAGGLSARRISRVLSYADGEKPGGAAGEEAAPAQQGSLTEPGASGDAWARIVPGREYEFAILFVEVEGSDELKKLHEPDSLVGAMETFRSYVERIASQHGGRTWMWSQFEGLVLFPLRGGVTSAPVCGLRLLMSRIFYDVEESLLPGHISFHLALSTGTTVYREHDTGDIISDSLNSVFHLGKRHTRPGQFFISADAMGLVPQRLKVLCVPVGSYEGKRVFRMIPPRPQLLRGEGNGQRSG